eukprot:TRINITY_DN5714_c0_g1_i1.p1 TRINITY_DN5714_c0_g1~~TRINITY_DN5714_c0_g1_i1.p1  ORF type:complete len:340 (+),score=64.54 TRINITY_DN5714_c0_g1_i1:798-1817(+)
MVAYKKLFFLVFIALSLSLAQRDVPFITLHNAAERDVRMPVVGIGTGGYGNAQGQGGEFWNDTTAYNAVKQWLALGGRRIDTSIDYGTQKGIAQAIIESKIPREELFITSKVGPRFGLGYQETIDQYNTILEELQTQYVDLVLIHWPGWANGSDTPTPNCNKTDGSWKICRQDSWRALEDLFKDRKVRAIGVSNFERRHLEDIFELKSLLPSVNQVEFHPYWHEDDLVAFCKEHNILFNAYSPLGAPDHMATTWKPSILGNADIIAVAKAHQRTPAQIMLRWLLQQGIVTNPRTMNPDHMKENLDYFDFQLKETEMKQISTVINPSSVKKVCPDPNLIP